MTRHTARHPPCRATMSCRVTARHSSPHDTLHDIPHRTTYFVHGTTPPSYISRHISLHGTTFPIRMYLARRKVTFWPAGFEVFLRINIVDLARRRVTFCPAVLVDQALERGFVCVCSADGRHFLCADKELRYKRKGLSRLLRCCFTA